MNMPCGSDYEKKLHSSGMTLSDLHDDKDKVLKMFEEIMDEEEKYYNGTKTNASIKMK